MYLLYIDESGDPHNTGEHFVVAGVAVHEAAVRSLNRAVEGVAATHLAPHLVGLRGLELHAQAIRSGKDGWRGIPADVKAGLLSAVPRTVGRFARRADCTLLAVVRAPGAVPGVDPLERVFEELLLRFNSKLMRTGEERGIAVADEAKYESVLQPLVRKWSTAGVRDRRLSRIVEVPLFVDSHATRLTQAADFVSHAVWRHYEHGEDAMMDPLLAGFDASDGVLHGLVHLVESYRRCPCPACLSRVQAIRRRKTAPSNP